MSAQLLPLVTEEKETIIECGSTIALSAALMERMINDLLDYTRTRLGTGMPVKPVTMDLTPLGRELIAEFRAAHPQREIKFHSVGDLNGQWDRDRIRQAISNLVGNAIQHGSVDYPISLTLEGEDADVSIKIHNGGDPIPPNELPKVFNPLVRGSSAEQPSHNRPGSIGMGLYIAREVAKSHGGQINVVSTAEAGTSFTIRLPRHSPPRVGQPILDAQHIATM